MYQSVKHSVYQTQKQLTNFYRSFYATLEDVEFGIEVAQEEIRMKIGNDKAKAQVHLANLLIRKGELDV